MSSGDEMNASGKGEALDTAPFERLLQRSSEAFFILTLTEDVSCTYVSPQIESLTGYSPQSYLGDPSLFRRVVEPEHLPTVLAAFEHLVGGQSSSSLECPIRHASGDVKWLRCSAFRVTGRANRLTAIEGVLSDVTEHRRLRDAISANEQGFSLLFRTVPMPSTITTFDGVYVDVSDTYCELSGYSREDVVGKHATDLGIWVDPGDRDRMIQTFKERGSVSALEVRFRSKDRSIVVVELFAKVINLDDRPVILSVTRDLTRQRRAEEDRRQMERHIERTQRLESLGVFAGGIAHDFNNMLAVISGNAGLGRQRLMDSRTEVALRCFDEIEQAAIQARHLTQQLRTFARGGAPQREVITLEPIIREAASFALTGSRHRCVFEIAHDLWMVDVDAGQLRQVLHNLVLNADQAMASPGVVQLRAMNVTAPSFPPGNWVKVSVIDTGPGVPAEIAAKIFDPFFTAKDGGTGLGLAISHSIIAAHGGRLELETTPGVQECTFSFWIPAADREAPPARPITSEPRVKRGLHVLVLDDQAALITVMKAGLEDQGHRVHCVRDGRDAIEAYRVALERGDRIDVCVMDLTIPGGLGGAEALKALKALDPEVVAIAASGYSNDPVMADYAAFGFAARLSKPFRQSDLHETIAAALERRD
jgi:PAS domain S-box-containing protein